MQPSLYPLGSEDHAEHHSPGQGPTPTGSWGNIFPSHLGDLPGKKALNVPTNSFGAFWDEGGQDEGHEGANAVKCGFI